MKLEIDTCFGDFWEELRILIYISWDVKVKCCWTMHKHENKSTIIYIMKYEHEHERKKKMYKRLMYRDESSSLH
jgi:hypothetical protein